MEGCRLSANGTIGASSSVVHTIPLNGARLLSVSVQNTGSNDITSVEVYGTPLGAVSGKDAALSSAFGTISPGALNAKLQRIESLSLEAVTLILSSTLGTSYALEAKGSY